MNKESRKRCMILISRSKYDMGFPRHIRHQNNAIKKTRSKILVQAYILVASCIIPKKLLPSIASFRLYSQHEVDKLIFY